MNLTTYSKTIAKYMAVVCCISLALFLWLTYDYLQFDKQLVLAAKNQAKNEANRASKQISNELAKLMPLANSIADDLTNGKLKKQQLTERLKRTIDFNPEIFGVGAAFEPFAYDADIRLYAPYYIRKNGEPELIQLDAFYDYTEPEYKWYHTPLVGKAGWNEPYFGQASDALLAEYSVPFYQVDESGVDKTAEGVVYINYTLNDLKRIMTSLKLGQSGYGFIISKKGVFICHPIEDYVNEQKSIFDVASNLDNDALRKMGELAISGKTGVIDYVNVFTNQASWLFYEPIPDTGWSMGVIIIKEETLGNTEIRRRKLIHISIDVFVFLLSLSLLACRIFKLTRWSLWAASVAASALCVAMTVLVIFLSMKFPNHLSFESTNIYDKAGLNKYLDAYTTASIEKKVSLPIYVPTGIFIQSIKFDSSHNVVLTGYVWQKYIDGLHDGLSRGFVMPEEESSTIIEAYRQREGNIEVVGWYFTVSLRERFDYSKYPFGTENVWIRLWHKDFEKNVVLTPDLAAYNVMNPMSLPGLEEEFVLSGWKINRSFFSYRKHSYNTNFGIDDYVGQIKFPELYFNVILKKEFLSPFITNILPVSVVLFLLFAILLIGNKKLLEIVSSSAAFFLVVIFSQIDLREKISTNEIIYMEHFYFIAYFVILAVAVNSVLYARTKIKIIHYDDNLISHVLYWPVIMSMMLGITLFIFY